MIHAGYRSKTIAALFSVVILIGASAAPAAWAGTGQPASDISPNNDSDAAASLTVMNDFNRDGILDVIRASESSAGRQSPGILSVSLGMPNGQFQPARSMPILDPHPTAIATGDFNHDGIPDVIVGDEDGSLRLFLGDGKGNLTPAGEIAQLSSVVSIAVGDLNHDGIPDLAVTDWRSSTVTVLLGTGKGTFHQAWSSPLRMPGTSPDVVIADFNGDGNPDLAVVYGDDDYTYDVMVGNGRGAFTDSPKLSSVKDPNAHCVT
jgi:hypothetical protein